MTQTDSGGLTPLVYAWSNEHWEVVLCLVNYIQEKGLFHEKDYLLPSFEAIFSQFLKLGLFKQNSLDVACRLNLLQTLQCLCKLKRNSDLKVSWSIARSDGDLPTMKFLIKYADYLYLYISDFHRACVLDRRYNSGNKDDKLEWH